MSRVPNTVVKFGLANTKNYVVRVQKADKTYILIQPFEKTPTQFVDSDFVPNYLSSFINSNTLRIVR